MDFWAWLRSLFTPKPAPVTPVAPTSGVTVLTLAPAYFGFNLGWLRGEPFAGRTVKAVAYPNTPSPQNFDAGVNALDAAMHTYTGQLVIIGHSMGAEVAQGWLKRKGATSDIDPARAEFIFTGNPERKGTGVMVQPSNPWWVVYQYGAPGPGLPADTRYTVRDLTRRGDFWADYPHCTNQMAGMAIHGDYTKVSLNSAATDAVEGNVTYLSAP